MVLASILLTLALGTLGGLLFVAADYRYEIL